MLLARLLWLQVLHGPEYKRFSEENAVRKTILSAPRGAVYDQNCIVLVGNRPSFAVEILPGNYTNPAVTPLFAQILEVRTDEINKMRTAAQESTYTPVILKRDVGQTILAKIEEQKNYLSGVVLEVVPVRQYVYRAMAAQIFGYLGNISAIEYRQRKNQGYHISDFIGKAGLELVYENYLKGTDGSYEVEVNAAGEEVKLLGTRPAKPGKAITLTIDANLQKAAETVLSETITASRYRGDPAKGAAAVVLEVKTGAVLAMVSQPAYDPNIFAAGISEAAWQKIVNDPLSPMTNRVIENTFPLGSVFKIITGAADLDTKATTPSEIFYDTGKYILNGWTFYGWAPKGLGRLNLSDALTWSSDPVFYELGRRIGINKLADYAATFGFGQKTGINLLGEAAGNVPTTEWKEQTYKEEWYPGETLIAAIGQGYWLLRCSRRYWQWL